MYLRKQYAIANSALNKTKEEILSKIKALFGLKK